MSTTLKYPPVAKLLREMQEREDRPIVELHRWCQVGKILVAEEVRNHPKLGTIVARNGDAIRTSNVTYLNREARIAITLNTVYVLFDEVRS